MHPIRETHPQYLDPNQSQLFQDQLVKDIITEIDLAQVEKAQQGGLTRDQIIACHQRLEQIAAEGEALFGSTGNLSDNNVQEFIKKQLVKLASSMLETAASQPPDLIREASMSEAVFSHKGDSHPILATDALATCIGVAGYDPINQFGFVVHLSREDELTASGDLLLNRMHAYRTQNSQAPLLIHLRGGVKGWSESLLQKVKEWIAHPNLNSIIASEDTLQAPIAAGIGVPKVIGSLKLDVRTGTCEIYDATTNFYSESFKNREKKALSETDANLAVKCLIQVATKKPCITIVYDAKNQ